MAGCQCPLRHPPHPRLLNGSSVQILTLAIAIAVAAPEAPSVELARHDGGNIQRPAWSPDGFKLSYEANYHERKVIELYVGDTDGEFTRVRPDDSSLGSLTAGFSSRSSAGKVSHEISWSPPAIGRFVYTASSNNMDYDLYIDGGGALSPSPQADGGAAWSPGGNHIVFTSARTGQGDLYLLDLVSLDAEPRQLTGDAHSAELFPAWSSDGTQLAFVGHSPTGDNLWLMNSLTAPPAQLTNWTGTQLRPTFSPDGSNIAFYANRDDPERFDLYVVEPKVGAEAVLLVKDVLPNSRGPCWSPDSRHVLFTEHNDVQFNPLAFVPVAHPLGMQLIHLDTVGHGDFDAVPDRDGTMKLAYVAQGRRDDSKRTFKRLYFTKIRLP